jgi:hypothetical protein
MMNIILNVLCDARLLALVELTVAAALVSLAA